MCLAISALIESIEGHQDEVDIWGSRRIVNIQLVPQTEIGEYESIHTGYATSVIDEEEIPSDPQTPREIRR